MRKGSMKKEDLNVKAICPNCGFEFLEMGEMIEEGEPIPILVCKSCRWYG